VWLGGPLGDLVLDLTAERGFRDEPLWDGRRIHAAAAAALANGDSLTVRRLWPFVQARLLQQAFRDAAPPQVREPKIPLPAAASAG
jgi:hypothetical protein